MTFGPVRDTYVFSERTPCLISFEGSSLGARTTSIDKFKEFLEVFQYEGYSEVDTSRLYQNGQQEAFIAAAGWKDRRLKLSTKVGSPQQTTKRKIDL